MGVSGGAGRDGDVHAVVFDLVLVNNQRVNDPEPAANARNDVDDNGSIFPAGGGHEVQPPAMPRSTVSPSVTFPRD